MTPSRKATILLVDDDADDRFIFSSAVADMGSLLHCECVSGTLEALNYLQQADSLPDLIFLDLNMPGYDGKKCLGHLKNAERLQNIPVIIYSTYISQAVHDEMLRLGANHVVTKPGDFKSLQTAILKSLESINSPT